MIGMDWTRLDWTGLDQTGLDQTGLVSTDVQQKCLLLHLELALLRIYLKTFLEIVILFSLSSSFFLLLCCLFEDVNLCIVVLYLFDPIIQPVFFGYLVCYQKYDSTAVTSVVVISDNLFLCDNQQIIGCETVAVCWIDIHFIANFFTYFGKCHMQITRTLFPHEHYFCFITMRPQKFLVVLIAVIINWCLFLSQLLTKLCYLSRGNVTTLIKFFVLIVRTSAH